MHITQAVILTIPGGSGATDMIALLRWAVFGTGHFVLFAVMITSAVLALYGALFRVGWPRITLFVPQIILLGIEALGGIDAASAGSYLDGTVVPGAFAHILNDQIGYACLLAIHFIAIIWRAQDG